MKWFKVSFYSVGNTSSYVVMTEQKLEKTLKEFSECHNSITLKGVFNDDGTSPMIAYKHIERISYKEVDKEWMTSEETKADE